MFIFKCNPLLSVGYDDYKKAKEKLSLVISRAYLEMKFERLQRTFQQTAEMIKMGEK